LVSCCRKAVNINENISLLTKEKKQLEIMLKEMSENKNSRSGDYRYAYHERMGGVDYKAIPELKNIDLEQYRKAPAIVWLLNKAK